MGAAVVGKPVVRLCVRLCVLACLPASVRASVRPCVRASVRACVCCMCVRASVRTSAPIRPMPCLRPMPKTHAMLLSRGVRSQAYSHAVARVVRVWDAGGAQPLGGSPLYTLFVC